MWRLLPARTRLLVAVALALLGSLLVPGPQASAESTGSIRGTVSLGQATGPTKLVMWLYHYVDGSWTLINGRYVAPDGSWAYNGAAPGTYRVGFTDQNDVYRPGFYPQAESVAASQDVSVRAGQTTTIGSTALTAYAAISGTVSTAASVNGSVSGVRAIALSRDGSNWLAAGSATVDATGSFKIGRLLPGSYRLRLQDPTGTLATTHWSSGDPGGTSWLSEASDVSISADGQVVGGRDVTMVAASWVEGRVSADQGAPAAGATAVLYRVLGDGSCEGVAQTQTDASGAYRFEGLSRGNYRVGFSNGRVTSYWSQALSLAAATTLSLAATEHRVGIDGSLVAPAPASPPVVAMPAPTTVLSVDASTSTPGSPTAAKVVGPVPTSGVGSGTAPAPAAAAKSVPTSLSLIAAPTLSGVAKSGKVLSASTGTWSPTSALLTYRWFVGTKPVAGATMPTLKLTAKLRGKKVRAQVTGSFAGRVISSYTPWSAAVR